LTNIILSHLFEEMGLFGYCATWVVCCSRYLCSIVRGRRLRCKGCYVVPLRAPVNLLSSIGLSELRTNWKRCEMNLTQNNIFNLVQVPPLQKYECCWVVHNHTPYLTPWRKVLLDRLTDFKPVKKFPAFHGTRRFITTCASARRLSKTWASSIQSISPHPASWRHILILYSQLCLGHPSGLFPSCFPTKTWYVPFLSPIRATCSTSRIPFDFITRTILGQEYRSLSSSLCSFPHSPVTWSLLGPNILHSTIFSNTLSHRSSHSVSDQVLHPYKTKGKTMVLNTLILKCFIAKLKNEDFASNDDKQTLTSVFS
jgi:hypothetical protein